MEKLIGELFRLGFIVITLVAMLGATVFYKEWKANIGIEPGGFWYCGIIGLGFIVFGLLCASHAISPLFSK